MADEKKNLEIAKKIAETTAAAVMDDIRELDLPTGAADVSATSIWCDLGCAVGCGAGCVAGGAVASVVASAAATVVSSAL